MAGNRDFQLQSKGPRLTVGLFAANSERRTVDRIHLSLVAA
jgi:hypothetical protein